MNQKPGDLLLGVIDFFGILVPGAILTFLYGDFLLGPLGLSMGKLQTLSDWIPAFFIAYVLGHFLLGSSVPLNGLAVRLPTKVTEAYFHAIRALVELPPGVDRNPTNVYHSAYSYVRIKDPEAIAEVERQAAEYKLFRSLTLLFALDVPLSIWSHSFSPGRLLISLVVTALAFIRFVSLFNWSYQLAYDFYLQLQRFQKE